MKVYIKSAVNISDIQAKIAKKQAEIDKKTAWIAKKEVSLTKRLAIIEPAVSSEEFSRIKDYIEYLKNNNSYRMPQEYEITDIRRKFPWGDTVGEALYGVREDAESIYNSKEAISEAKRIVDKYTSQIDAIRAKGEEIDRIPDCLKEFMNDVVARWDRHDLRIKNEGKPYYSELSHNAWVILYGESSTGMPSVGEAKLAELYPDVPANKGYYSLSSYRRKLFDNEYITQPFESVYGSLNYARSIWDLSDEKIHSDNVKAGENLILDLLKRVTKITGPVIDWSGLHVTQGNMGAVINGYVVGEDGKAEVESILAGGYNVQKLHVRVLVKSLRD